MPAPLQVSSLPTAWILRSYSSPSRKSNALRTDERSVAWSLMSRHE